jgi:hypothetical protein
VPRTVGLRDSLPVLEAGRETASFCSGSCDCEELYVAVDTVEKVHAAAIQGDIGAGRQIPARSWRPGSISRVA